MFDDFYRGKRAFVTGHTGFKGSWLSLWLNQLGATVTGYGLKAPTQPNLHRLIQEQAFSQEIFEDIRDLKQLRRSLSRTKPDIIFHLAAQPIVRRSYREPLETWDINAFGTANLLEAVRQLELPSTIIVITSDKCYENVGWEYGYRENDPLGGYDVYSMSKAAAELVVQSWRRSFFEGNPKLGNVASARAGNVIGGGDYAENRIVPDCVRSLIKKQPIPVRNPGATRPWQHVLDCLSGYLWLGRCLSQSKKGSPLASAFNFGPGVQADLPVSYLVEDILKLWPGAWKHTPPKTELHEAPKLNLAIDKAAALLGWYPVWSFENAIAKTVSWYYRRHVTKASDLLEYSVQQIEEFSADALSKSMRWAVRNAA